MDIGAYARIDDLSNILASAGVDIPRLRGLRLMATEEKISEEEIKEMTASADVDAVEEVLKNYDGYIDNLSRRKMYDEYGQIHYCVDETLKRRLQTKLLIKTLNFKIGN